MQKSSKIWLDAPALLLDFKIWKFSFLISKRNYTTECLELPLYVQKGCDQQTLKASSLSEESLSLSDLNDDISC